MLRPGVDTTTGTIDGTRISFLLVAIYRRRDVYLGEERTTLVVVTTEDSTEYLCLLTGIFVVYLCLIYITRRQNLFAVSTTEDAVNLDAGLCWDIHHRATGDTLSVTTAIRVMDTSVQQVDDGGGFIKIKVLSKGFCRGIVHTDSIITTGTEHLSFTKISHAIRDIDKHVTTLLSTIVLSDTRVTCTTTIGMEDIVLCMVLRTDIHKGALLFWHRTSFAVKRGITIIIGTITTTEDRIDTSLQVFHVRR